MSISSTTDRSSAFAHPFSNYTPVYLYLMAFASLFHGWMSPLYLIKILSVAGTAFAALAVADLVRTMGGRSRHAVLLLIMPPAVINAALWRSAMPCGRVPACSPSRR